MQPGTDLRINLLPWREELRRGQKLAFLRLLGGLVLLAALVIALASLRLTLLLWHQQERNDYLQEEISIRKEKLAAVGQFNRQREALLARLRVTEDLQRQRSTLVHIFREVSLRLEDGVFFTAISHEKAQLQLKGVASSGERISAQLQSLTEWDLFAPPQITAVNSAPDYGLLAGEFQVNLPGSIRQEDATGEAAEP